MRSSIIGMIKYYRVRSPNAPGEGVVGDHAPKVAKRQNGFTLVFRTWFLAGHADLLPVISLE